SPEYPIQLRHYASDRRCSNFAESGRNANGPKLSSRPFATPPVRVLSLCCLGGVGRFGLLGQLGKPRGVVDSNVCQDLAIQLDAGLLQSTDELRVASAVQLGGCRDAHDPQGAELALLLAATGVGKLKAALDSFLSGLIELGFGKEVTARAIENLFAAVVALGTAFYAGHRLLRLCCVCLAAGGRRANFVGR